MQDADDVLVRQVGARLDVAEGQRLVCAQQPHEAREPWGEVASRPPLGGSYRAAGMHKAGGAAVRTGAISRISVLKHCHMKGSFLHARPTFFN